MKKPTKPKFDIEKYIELCNQREMKMYNLRQQGVHFSQQLREVLPISIQITSMTLGEKAEEFEENYVRLQLEREKAEENEDEEKVNLITNKIRELCASLGQINEEPVGSIQALYDLLGATGFDGVPNTKINGKHTYKRLLIQKVGYKKYLGNGLYEVYLKNGAKPLITGENVTFNTF